MSALATPPSNSPSPSRAKVPSHWMHDSSPLDELALGSERMRELVETARRLADVPTTVLLEGETGVGKEHFARALHAAGPRTGAPFLSVNCGAFPETLLESELFGHSKGAFTGADRIREGVFEAAEAGTLLLDEIGELPPHLQVKLLNVLERREFVRLGETRPRPIHARVLAATNRVLADEVDRGAFRMDLLYRLNVVTLTIPPLRERPEDVSALIQRALLELRDILPAARTVTGVTPSALSVLLAHVWPGNVRELRNVIERAIVLGPLEDGRITVDSLPHGLRLTAVEANRRRSPLQLAKGSTLREAREQAIAIAECEFLDRALHEHRGRIAETAETAGLHPRSLHDKMKRYGLRKEDYRPGAGGHTRT